MFRIIVWLILFLFPFGATAQTFEKKLNIAPLKEDATRYAYIPFDVPANVKSLSVSYEYDKKGGANVLDLGVFDSCSKSESDICGFRGWSGGRRNTIFIAETTATNGYVPGKISAGEWRVILGLYKIAPEGVEVTIKISINEIDIQAAQQLADEKERGFDFLTAPRVAAQKTNGYTWFRGDLHTHTFHSDGSWTVKAVLDYANANNLDFVSITDHNTFSHHAEIDRLAPNYKNLLVMRGEEATTYGGHFNVWGLPPGKLVDFRVTPSNVKQLADVLREKSAPKLFASINHPTALCGGCDWSYGDDLWTAVSSVEIWNGAWDWQDEAALQKWDTMLQKGKRVRAIGSSDSHSPPAEQNAYATNLAIGTPTNFVGVRKLTQKDILEAIENGRAWVAENPNYNLNFTGENNNSRAVIGDSLFVARDKTVKFAFSGREFPVGATVAIISGGTALQKTTLDKTAFALNFTIKSNGSEYFRIEVRDSAGKMLAFTNPIYTQNKK